MAASSPASTSHRRGQYDRDLPVGQHPLQLYSLATPNGQKVTILLEELLEAAMTPNMTRG